MPSRVSHPPRSAAAPQAPASSFLLHLLFEAFQGPSPEGVQLVSEGDDASGIEPVLSLRALWPITDQVEAFEHLQMLRNRRLTDRESGGQLADRALALGELSQDRAACPVCESGPHLRLFISHNE